MVTFYFVRLLHLLPGILFVPVINAATRTRITEIKTTDILDDILVENIPIIVDDYVSTETTLTTPRRKSSFNTTPTPGQPIPTYSTTVSFQAPISPQTVNQHAVRMRWSRVRQPVGFDPSSLDPLGDLYGTDKEGREEYLRDEESKRPSLSRTLGRKMGWEIFSGLVGMMPLHTSIGKNGDGDRKGAAYQIMDDWRDGKFKDLEPICSVQAYQTEEDENDYDDESDIERGEEERCLIKFESIRLSHGVSYVLRTSLRTKVKDHPAAKKTKSTSGTKAKRSATEDKDWVFTTTDTSVAGLPYSHTFAEYFVNLKVISPDYETGGQPLPDWRKMMAPPSENGDDDDSNSRVIGEEKSPFGRKKHNVVDSCQSIMEVAKVVLGFDVPLARVRPGPVLEGKFVVPSLEELEAMEIEEIREMEKQRLEKMKLERDLYYEYLDGNEEEYTGPSAAATIEKQWNDPLSPVTGLIWDGAIVEICRSAGLSPTECLDTFREELFEDIDNENIDNVIEGEESMSKTKIGHETPSSANEDDVNELLRVDAAVDAFIEAHGEREIEENDVDHDSGSNLKARTTTTTGRVVPLSLEGMDADEILDLVHDIEGIENAIAEGERTEGIWEQDILEPKYDDLIIDPNPMDYDNALYNDDEIMTKGKVDVCGEDSTGEDVCVSVNSNIE